MQSRGLKQLVGKVFSDEGFKTRFLNSPEKEMANFGLSERETKAALSVQRNIGLVSSHSTALDAAIDPTVQWT